MFEAFFYKNSHIDTRNETGLPWLLLGRPVINGITTFIVSVITTSFITMISLSASIGRSLPWPKLRLRGSAYMVFRLVV